MFFRMVYDDMLAQAAYLIGCQRTGEALIIDPERDIDRYVKIAESERLRITAIAETHIHADFLSGARELAEATGARLFLSGMGGKDWSYQWLDKKKDGGSYAHTLLRDGDSFKVGNVEVKAIHTPGHTPEHICFQVTDRGGGASAPMGIATGDFVFVGDVGRPDLLESAAGLKGAAEKERLALIEGATVDLASARGLSLCTFSNGLGAATGAVSVFWTFGSESLTRLIRRQMTCFTSAPADGATWGR